MLATRLPCLSCFKIPIRNKPNAVAPFNPGRRCAHSRWTRHAAPKTDWTALAVGDDVPVEEDPDFKEAINEVCNKALRAMLQEDLFKVKALRDELNNLGAYFASQKNLKAALFCYVLLRMSAHIVPKEAEGLEGLYKAAFEKLYILLEDSGWALQPEQQQEEEAEVDAEAEAEAEKE